MPDQSEVTPCATAALTAVEALSECDVALHVAEALVHDLDLIGWEVRPQVTADLAYITTFCDGADCTEAVPRNQGEAVGWTVWEADEFQGCALLCPDCTRRRKRGPVPPDAQACVVRDGWCETHNTGSVVPDGQ